LFLYFKRGARRGGCHNDACAAYYTREDVVEIQGHGGPLALQRMLRLVLAQGGARMANAGEFTLACIPEWAAVTLRKLKRLWT
jgi:hypothetical protein